MKTLNIYWKKTGPALYLIKTFCFVPFVIISIQWTNILAMKMTVPFRGQTKQEVMAVPIQCHSEGDTIFNAVLKSSLLVFQ